MAVVLSLRCPGDAPVAWCARADAGTFSETHELIESRAALTARAVRWATDALAHDDTTVSALGRPPTATVSCRTTGSTGIRTILAVTGAVRAGAGPQVRRVGADENADD
jgi:hypothetical protein